MGFFGEFTEFIRCMKASRKYGIASRQMNRDELKAARDTFLAALQLLGTEQPKNSNVGVWFSTRFQALRGLAYCAAKMNDVALARSSIEDAMSLWSASNAGPATKYRGLPEWLAWARDYLARSGNGGVH
jgi:hypothetical protein